MRVESAGGTIGYVIPITSSILSRPRNRTFICSSSNVLLGVAGLVALTRLGPSHAVPLNHSWRI
nr:MAG TPA: hypothetical protein [Caudoviricetes sp.]